MNIKLSALTIGLLVGSMVFASSVSAAFIDNDSYTTDTESSLDWLDVTQSLGMSFNTVNSQFGTGDQFEGWRYATAADFTGLISHYTDTPLSNGNNTFDLFSLAELVSWLGATYLNSEGAYVYGILSTVSPIPWKRSVAMVYTSESGNGITDQTDTLATSIGAGSANNGIGSFLVKDTSIPNVSEPPVFFLVGSGLLVLIGFYHKRKLTQT